MTPKRLSREGGGRLVQDERAHPGPGDGLRDLHDLLMGDPEGPDRPPRVDGRAAEGAEHLAGDRRPPPAVQEAAAGGLAPEHDVLGDAEVRDQGELLVDRAHPLVERLARRGQVDGAAADRDGPLVRAVDPRQHLHDGGLAGAVLPDEGVHLARRHGERGAADGVHGAEALVHALQGDGRGARHEDASARAGRRRTSRRRSTGRSPPRRRSTITASTMITPVRICWM